MSVGCGPGAACTAFFLGSSVSVSSLEFSDTTCDFLLYDGHMAMLVGSCFC